LALYDRICFIVDETASGEKLDARGLQDELELELRRLVPEHDGVDFPRRFRAVLVHHQAELGR